MNGLTRFAQSTAPQISVKTPKLLLALALTTLALTTPSIGHATGLELSPEMIRLAQSEAEKFLDYSDNEIAGGLSGEIQKPRLENIVEMSPGVWMATIVSEAFYYSQDFDFGDPVDEVDTVCRTDIEARQVNLDLSLKALKTTCDLDPRLEAAEDEGIIQDEP